jgi:diaminobutyrate-2-oxoglutarate transaminase
MDMLETFTRLESNVRGYCRSFPTKFHRAKGATLVDVRGKEYIDFFAGAGALNYGHNPDPLKSKLIDYLQQDLVTHSLDMATTAKENFLTTFEKVILQPRQMEYKTMFPGPTGTNAIESALKLARKVTGRLNVVAFTNAFHGMTLGSLALTGNSTKRDGAGTPLPNVSRMPFCGYLGMDVDSLQILEHNLEDSGSGVDAPAAFVVETVQAEGGVNVASVSWLRELQRLAHQYGALLIMDDIQVGCGRTGPFFSFEPAGIQPDIICLSKSLSGYGLPLATVLIRPELDQWEPGEHNGTFRGHNPAFVTAAAALEHYWSDDQLTRKVRRDALQVQDVLLDLAEQFGAEARGRGMIQGIDLGDGELASRVSQEAFQRGLIIETAGPEDQVVKTLAPLTISSEALNRGLDILRDSMTAVLGKGKKSSSAVVAAKTTTS